MHGEHLSIFNDISTAPGIGANRARILKGFGIKTIEDLIYTFPKRYIDRSKVLSIGELKPGEKATVIGIVRSLTSRKLPRKNITITEATVFDGTGYVKAVWFGQRYLENRIMTGNKIALNGKVSLFRGTIQLDNPDFDVLDNIGMNEALSTGRIIPLYPNVQKISPYFLRKAIKNVLERIKTIEEILPLEVVLKNDLLPRDNAIREIHFPSSFSTLKKAKIRFAYEELFLLQVGIAEFKKRFQQEGKGRSLKAEGKLVDAFLKSIPFKLTASQKYAIDEIIQNINSTKPMNRLLEGEVGSGKTLVALAAAVYVAEAKCQTAYMAPTEVLAEQQYLKHRGSLEKIGIRAGIITSGVKGKEKKEALIKVNSGEWDIVFGTHSLIYEDVKFHDLALVIIDEQHRFGTEQRRALAKKGNTPDVLIMTATPIPRTLALTVFGDLDVTVIDEMPQGIPFSLRVKTKILKENERRHAYETLKKEIEKGRQGFIIVPLVEASDVLEVRAIQHAEELIKQFYGKDIKYSILHGRQGIDEKRKVMSEFVEGNIPILIATTVVEVGIDVPNATVMIVENAERFGLAQLHQLRGRIGRSKLTGHFFAVSDMPTEESIERLEALKTSMDGFELAEKDLMIRGEGELLGVRQSGTSSLKVARFAKNTELLKKARDDAFKFVFADLKYSKIDKEIALKESRKRFSQLEMAFVS